MATSDSIPAFGGRGTIMIEPGLVMAAAPSTIEGAKYLLSKPPDHVRKQASEALDQALRNATHGPEERRLRIEVVVRNFGERLGRETLQQKREKFALKAFGSPSHQDSFAVQAFNRAHDELNSALGSNKVHGDGKSSVAPDSVVEDWYTYLRMAVAAEARKRTQNDAAWGDVGKRYRARVPASKDGWISSWATDVLDEFMALSAEDPSLARLNGQLHDVSLLAIGKAHARRELQLLEQAATEAHSTRRLLAYIGLMLAFVFEVDLVGLGDWVGLDSAATFLWDLLESASN